MYIDLLDVFKILQPDFFRGCVKILKEKKFADCKFPTSTNRFVSLTHFKK
jgi:hypothetical protein